MKQEMQGLGKLLEYCALHKKLRQVHDLNVPRDLVYVVMYNVDVAGQLFLRSICFQPRSICSNLGQFKLT